MPLQHEDSWRTFDFRYSRATAGIQPPGSVALADAPNAAPTLKIFRKRKTNNITKKILTNKEKLKSKQTKTYNDENMEEENQIKNTENQKSSTAWISCIAAATQWPPQLLDVIFLHS